MSEDRDRSAPPGDAHASEAETAGEAATPPAPEDTRRFTVLLLATAGVTAVLALVLFLIFAALGYAGAPYWSVGVAAVGGVVMRRILLDGPSAARVLLFTAGTLGGALLGLGLGNLVLS